MKSSSKNTNTSAANTLHSVTDWQPRPELLQAMKAIGSFAAAEENAIITDREISFDGRVGRTTITASNVDVLTVDGYRISERIDVRTPLPILDGFTDEQITLANTLTTTGAIVRYPGDEQWVLASGLPIFEVDTVALADLYTPLVADTGWSQALGVLAVMRYCVDSTSPGPVDIGIPHWDEPCFWKANEFEFAAEIMKHQGIFCNASESGLTAEFPWEKGATSAMLGDCTSLMTFQTDQSHPVAGNGLFFRLALPLSLDKDELAECANYLNVFETTGSDTPPFFGAWCSQMEDRTLSYAGFWPNCMFRRGTVLNIASWCKTRSKIARQALGNR